MVPGCKKEVPMSLPEVPVAPRILKFEAMPAKVAPGETAILRWVVQGAARVWLEEVVEGSGNWRRFELRELGDLARDGGIQVKPRSTTRYLLNCESQAGLACASLSVRVELK
jgi:hypothetical protein